jgi:uncharacterized protein YbjQ (UPF0145 family)
METEFSTWDIACLRQKNYQFGSLIMGNSIYATNVVEHIGSKSSRNLDIPEITHFLKKGRDLAFLNLKNKLPSQSSLANIQNKILLYPHNIEFITSGSVITSTDNKSLFTTHVNGQDLYALLDAGYQPISTVFGNVAYSFKSLEGFIVSFKTLRPQKMKELTNLVNEMRHSVLNCLVNEAKQQKAGIVLCINILLQSIGKINEMMMSGSTVSHPSIETSSNEVITSHLTSIETWSLSKLGYAPYRLLIYSNIYALGFSWPLINVFPSKEKSKLTKIIQYAREETIARIHEQAKSINADDVVGLKIYINQLGNGLIEFFAMGTAIKKSPMIKTESTQLLQEAIIHNKTSYYDYISDVKSGNSILISLSRIGLLLLIFIIIFSFI